MPVYVVAQGRIEDRQRLDEYVGKALPTIAAHGGKVLGFDESPDVIEGKVDRPRTVILEFDSKDQFRAWYDSSEYQKILPLRLAAAPGTMIVVEGLARG